MLSDTNKKSLNSILRFYKDRHRIKKGSSSTTLRFDSTSVSQKTFTKYLTRDQDVLRAHCGKKEYSNLVDTIEEAYKLEKTSDAVEQMSSLLFEKLGEICHKEEIDKHTGGKSKGDVKFFDYTGIIPIIDIKTSQTVMFNMDSGNVAFEAGYDTYQKWLKVQPSKVKEAHNLLFTPARIEFNPRVAGGYTTEVTTDGQEIIAVNSHSMPPWRTEEKKSPVLPKEFVELMEHLFPEEECREYLYNWMFHMLDSRSPIHLLLHSVRGIGKNTLVYILENLVGSSNYYTVPKNFFDNNFDSELRHKRLLYFDEHKIDSRLNEAEFKQYTDPRKAYHGKGLAISGLEINHASHIIANNQEVVNHIVSSSRRFSVPVVTHLPLVDVKGEEWISEIYRLARDKEFLANIGWWLLKNGQSSKWPKDSPYKSSLFHELVYKALYPWQKWIIDTIESGVTDQIDIADFQQSELMYKGTAIGRTKIEDFLRQHKDIDGDIFGYVKQMDKKRWIIPSDKYMRSF